MFNLKPSLAMSKLRNLCESLKSDHFIKKKFKNKCYFLPHRENKYLIMAFF